MAFNHWGFIYLGSSSENHPLEPIVIADGGLTTTIVAVSDRGAAIAAAVELVAGGAQLVELCGAFGPRIAAQVIQAVGEGVPVGSVSYGVESIPAMAALFAPSSPPAPAAAPPG